MSAASKSPARKRKPSPKMMALTTTDGRVEAVAMALAFSALTWTERIKFSEQARVLINSLRVACVR